LSSLIASADGGLSHVPDPPGDIAASAHDLTDLRALVEASAESHAMPPAEPVDFPRWNRHFVARDRR
jgi:hypothetical protein